MDLKEQGRLLAAIISAIAFGVAAGIASESFWVGALVIIGVFCALAALAADR